MERIEKIHLSEKEANLVRESIQHYASIILDILKKERAEWKDCKRIIEVTKTCLDVKDKFMRSKKVLDIDNIKPMTPEEEIADFYQRF